MRCAVLDCINNENGYCLDSSYVEIDENGCCDEMLVIAKHKNNEEESTNERS